MELLERSVHRGLEPMTGMLLSPLPWQQHHENTSPRIMYYDESQIRPIGGQSVGQSFENCTIYAYINAQICRQVY